MPVLAACHLIYICSVVLHYIAIHVVANKVLSLSLSLSLDLCRTAVQYINPVDKITCSAFVRQVVC